MSEITKGKVLANLKELEEMFSPAEENKIEDTTNTNFDEYNKLVDEINCLIFRVKKQLKGGSDGGSEAADELVDKLNSICEFQPEFINYKDGKKYSANLDSSKEDITLDVKELPVEEGGR